MLKSIMGHISRYFYRSPQCIWNCDLPSEDSNNILNQCMQFLDKPFLANNMFVAFLMTHHLWELSRHHINKQRILRQRGRMENHKVIHPHLCKWKSQTNSLSEPLTRLTWLVTLLVKYNFLFIFHINLLDIFSLSVYQ